MGPSEGGKRPCYPTPCNADWTPCTNQEEETLWTKDSTHTGKRPDCPFVKIRNDGANYLVIGRPITASKDPGAALDHISKVI